MPKRRNDKRNNGTERTRQVLAQEAARIIQEEGIADFQLAKRKAIERLGFRELGVLPTNAEIESALTERQRIFLGDQQDMIVRTLRTTALRLMQAMLEFKPKLVGSVLIGNPTTHSPVELHLFAEPPEVVGHRLQTLGTSPRSIQQKVRMRRDRVERLPAYRCHDGAVEIVATIFPDRYRGQSPLSPIDGKPMLRASVRRLEELIAHGPA